MDKKFMDRLQKQIERDEKIIQVSGFGVNNTSNTQCDYMLVGLTATGKVVISTGDGEWTDVSPKKNEKQ